jgi:hypothetical protein
MIDLKTRLLRSGSSRFLVVFLIISALTLALSLACGPDPRVKVYIFAEEETAVALSTLIDREVEGELVFYTPLDELNDLDVLVSTKTIRVILIADHPLTRDTNRSFGKLENAIAEVEHVFVLKSFEEHAFPSIIIASLPEKVKIGSSREVCEVIRGMKRNNYRSYSSYEFFLKILAMFSLVLVGVGGAFCSSRILESRSISQSKRIVEATLLAGLVFLLIQWVYFTSSVIVETPISLHTTYARITAVSLLGPFGGGTIPRILSSAIGMLLGIFLTSRRIGQKISPTVFPLTVFGMALLLTEGINMFGIVDNPLGVLIRRFGFLFYDPLLHTGRVTYTEVIFSRGVMMLFVGFLPLGVIKKMRSFLRSLAISFSVITGSWGLMRVGDMRFYVTLRSFLPGQGSSTNTRLPFKKQVLLV